MSNRLMKERIDSAMEMYPVLFKLPAKWMELKLCQDNSDFDCSKQEMLDMLRELMENLKEI